MQHSSRVIVPVGKWSPLSWCIFPSEEGMFYILNMVQLHTHSALLKILVNCFTIPNASFLSSTIEFPSFRETTFRLSPNSTRTWNKEALMGIKKQHFCLKIKQHNTPYPCFSHRWQPWTRETRSVEFWVFPKMAHHSSLIPRSSRLFMMAVESNFPPWDRCGCQNPNLCVPYEVKFPWVAQLPILGQTIDRCMRSRWLYIGQVLFLRGYGPRRSRGP